MMKTVPGSISWNELPKSRQVELLEAYGRYLDQLPPTCSMDTKVERFQAWLRERDIEYEQDTRR